MTPRNAFIIILAALSATFALAEDFRTMGGKEYRDAKVTRVEPDGIVVKTKSGISKVYFVELPQDVQRRFNIEPQQSQGAAQPLRPLLNEQPGDPSTREAGQGQKPTAFPDDAPRYTTGLGQLSQPTRPEAAKTPTTSNHPVQQATHPKTDEQKTDKQPKHNGT